MPAGTARDASPSALGIPRERGARRGIEDANRAGKGLHSRRFLSVVERQGKRRERRVKRPAWTAPTKRSRERGINEHGGSTRCSGRADREPRASAIRTSLALAASGCRPASIPESRVKARQGDTWIRRHRFCGSPRHGWGRLLGAPRRDSPIVPAGDAELLRINGRPQAKTWQHHFLEALCVREPGTSATALDVSQKGSSSALTGGRGAGETLVQRERTLERREIAFPATLELEREVLDGPLP